MITSLHNKRVAGAARLKKRALREKDRRFLVEGAQGVLEALSSGSVREVLVSAAPHERLDEVAEAASRAGVPVARVSDEVMAHLTSTVTPQGVVAVSEFVDVPLDAVSDGPGLLPVLVEVRDPGNAGAILRSADAAGAGGVVFTRSSVDVYNPKTVRASAGSLFHVPVVRELDVAEAVDSLRAGGWGILAASADGRTPLPEADLSQPTAVLFGNEARGLSGDARSLADDTVRIPIAGRAESLNLAAAATLVLFEWARRRDGDGADDRLSDMVAGAAHDIRSPLTALKAFASTLLSRWDRLDEDQRRGMLESIAGEALRMEVVVVQLVDAARLSAGSLTLAPAPTDLREAAREAVRTFSSWEPTEAEISGHPVMANVDPARLRTMVVGMIEAARWWAEEGPVRIWTGRDPLPTLKVSRATPSLGGSEVEELFAVRPPGSGSGSKIGLSVARDLAEASGGSLRGKADERLEFALELSDP